MTVVLPIGAVGATCSRDAPCRGGRGCKPLPQPRLVSVFSRGSTRLSTLRTPLGWLPLAAIQTCYRKKGSAAPASSFNDMAREAGAIDPGYSCHTEGGVGQPSRELSPEFLPELPRRSPHAISLILA